MDHLPGVDGEDVFDDAPSIPDVFFPSYAPSNVSGFPGDLDADDDDAKEPMLLKPDWSIEDLRGHMWLDGSWEAPTRCGGASQEIHVGGGTQTEGAEGGADPRCQGH